MAGAAGAWRGMKSVTALSLRWPMRESVNSVRHPQLTRGDHRIGYPTPATFKVKTEPAEKISPTMTGHQLRLRDPRTLTGEASTCRHRSTPAPAVETTHCAICGTCFPHGVAERWKTLCLIRSRRISEQTAAKHPEQALAKGGAE